MASPLPNRAWSSCSTQVVRGLRIPPQQSRGRSFVYSWPVMLACFVVMVSYRLTGFRSLHRFLGTHPARAQACGLPEGQVPSAWTFGRRFRRL